MQQTKQRKNSKILPNNMKSRKKVIKKFTEKQEKDIEGWELEDYEEEKKLDER